MRLHLCALTALVVMAACGGSDSAGLAAREGADTTVVADVTSTSDAGPSVSSTTRAPTTAKPKQKRLPVGPRDPSTPNGDNPPNWYDELALGQCDALAQQTKDASGQENQNPSVRVYRAAANACKGNVSAAQADLRALDADKNFNPTRCFYREVLAWARGVIEARKTDASLEFEPATAKSPCETTTSPPPTPSTTTTRPGTTTTKR